MNSANPADQSQQTGLLRRGAFSDMTQNRKFSKDVEIVFAEMNSVRVIRGISNIQTCNLILAVPPNAIINPKTA